MLELIFFIRILLIFISLFILDKNFYSSQKIEEFECGFNSLVNRRLSFSLQYFMLTILFLVFDLEIILIMPVILEIKSFFMIIDLLVWLLILLIMGLYIEWLYGLVNWSK